LREQNNKLKQIIEEYNRKLVYGQSNQSKEREAKAIETLQQTQKNEMNNVEQQLKLNKAPEMLNNQNGKIHSTHPEHFDQ
jgi:hypothetical protein